MIDTNTKEENVFEVSHIETVINSPITISQDLIFICELPFIDVDECTLIENGGCHPEARCINNVGSFQCQCKPGYDGDGKNCEDVNECDLGQASCAQDATCINTVGTFVCQCKAGFSGDGEICIGRLLFT